MVHTVQVSGSDAEQLITFLDGNGIHYEVITEEFHSWLDGAVVVITTVSSILTILHILIDWLEVRQREEQSSKVVIQLDGHIIDLSHDPDKAKKLLEDLTEEYDQSRRS